MHTKLFAKNRKLHKYATCNSNFKTKLFSDMHHRITYLYINFQQNWVSRSVKTCTQVYLQIFGNCINLQLAIKILKNHTFRTCTTPSRTFRTILRLTGLLDNELPRKEIISTDDRRTDGQTSRTTTIVFFSKKKNLLKTVIILTCLNFYSTKIIDCTVILNILYTHSII